MNFFKGDPMSATVQPFPKSGVLYNNLNLTKSELTERIGQRRNAAFSHIVRTVGLDRTSLCFEQYGSAPNFQGGLLTLCTCKHQMRSSLNLDQWKGKWIAGLTSRRLHEGRQWLFYLTRIAESHQSHADLWHNLPAEVRHAKSAERQFLGDLYRPQGKLTGEDRFVPGCYFSPTRHSHRHNSCDNGWHNDIDYGYADRYGRPALLVGEPHLTFLWEKPVIYFAEDHCRNFKKWRTATELIRHLKNEAQR